MTYIDTRDLHDELTALEARADAVALYLQSQESFEVIDLADNPDLDPLTEYEEVLLAELRNLCDAIGDEFRYGATMIPEDEFEDYARELAEDTGMISGDEGWPFNHIDWEAAAAELATDYTTVEWEGTTYLVRT